MTTLLQLRFPPAMKQEPLPGALQANTHEVLLQNQPGAHATGFEALLLSYRVWGSFGWGGRVGFSTPSRTGTLIMQEPLGRDHCLEFYCEQDRLEPVDESKGRPSSDSDATKYGLAVLGLGCGAFKML